MPRSDTPPPAGTRLRFKRLFDVVGAGLGLLMCSPVLALTALTIGLRDGRPLLYGDPRVGRAGREFRVIKFRTLRDHTGETRHVAPDDDPRLTKTGRWLRRWRLDEFPQLLNVLTGDMSLVGPRPLPPTHMASLPESARDELVSVRPGLTDPAAVFFLAEDAVLAGLPEPEAVYVRDLLPVKVAMQLDYIRRRSLLKDALVLAKTLCSVWSRARRKRSEDTLRRLVR